MARKSRKQNNQIQAIVTKPAFIQTAAYVRLSMEDANHKGDSIENQKRIISDYINNNPDLKLYDTYVDLGVSGTTFERPNFLRMMSDAEAGKIKCIIIKDLSRLGRNLIDTGHYIEKIFPALGVRLISVTDNYDTDIDSGGIILPIINLLNEAYVFDIAQKTRSQALQAMKDGIYVGGQPPFGYVRSTDNRRKLVVDEPAAEIVRKIFDWAANGISSREIAKRLTSTKIPSPTVYKHEHRPLKDASIAGYGLWYASTVDRILRNEIYVGRLVQGKTKVDYFKRRPVPPDEWIHAGECHEAIVSSEVFDIVRSLRRKTKEPLKSETAVKYFPNIFKGKIFCAHCGKHLERKKNHDKYIFHCIANRTIPDLCNGNRISEDAVRQALSEQLMQYRDVISKSLEEPSKEADILPELRWIEMELSQKHEITRSLYENLQTGILDEKEYMELKSSYAMKADDLNQRADTLKQVLEDEKIAKRRQRESVDVLDIFTGRPMLTKELVDRFVDRIVVFRDGRVHVDFVGVLKI